MITPIDYLDLLQIYARSHRKDGEPYLAEALHPDTGSFEGHDNYNHSEHYFHSGYCDLVITGLVGLVPRDDDTLEVNPLAPAKWDYFAIDDVPYRGHLVSVLWDKHGDRYGFGAGLHLLVDGKKVGTSRKLQQWVVRNAVPVASVIPVVESSGAVQTNFAVNNDGTYYPRVMATYTSSGSSISKLVDGNYWYLEHPPNRWTCADSPNESDSIVVDFGMPRPIHTVKLYVLDDGTDSSIRSPREINVEAWIDGDWKAIETGLNEDPTTKVGAIQGHRPYEVEFNIVKTRKLRVTLHHREGSKSGLTEVEAWGDAMLPLDSVPPPSGNVAYNPTGRGYPKASASHSDRFGGNPPNSIDGITNFLPTPMNRWTSFESNSPTDWLEVDFGKRTKFSRIELAIYDDHGGVQPPKSYQVQYWDGDHWSDVNDQQTDPVRPAGSQWNVVRFNPVTSEKVRIVFTHAKLSRSGVTEVMIWNE